MPTPQELWPNFYALAQGVPSLPSVQLPMFGSASPDAFGAMPTEEMPAPDAGGGTSGLLVAGVVLIVVLLVFNSHK